ncbi:MAG: hypothetical protein K8R86_07465, partial [Bacteroidales bacterium]|nr:hypothetical protein [Bacteroidales bacterium]
MRNKTIIRLKSFVLFILLFLSAPNTHTQNKTDSLLNVLHTENLNDSEQSLLYYQIAKTYLEVNLDSARYFATKGLKIAKQSEYIDGVLKNTIILGDIPLRKDSLIEARK